MEGKGKKVHIIGIGGTGMSALAGLFREKGYEVRGSDISKPYPPVGDLLDKLGIDVYYPYTPDNLLWGPDMVVIGNVIRKTNPEAMAAMEKGLYYISGPDALREFFLQGKKPLVIAGTHGKTTSSSLLAYLLDKEGLDPSFFIGGIPINFEKNFKLGKGEFFVVEGDEYDTVFYDKTPKFIHYSPYGGIILNVEYDHADIYKNIEEVTNAFEMFARTIPEGNPLVINEENQRCLEICRKFRTNVVTFGLEKGEYRGENIRWTDGKASFILTKNGWGVGEFSMPLIGEHNLRNCIAVLALLFELGKTEGLAYHLLGFRGVKKRQEIKGVVKGVTIIDDFAHHPTAVRETIKAVRCAYPSARIIALFEPESNTSRRRVFQDEYVMAFREADLVFFTTPLEKNDGLKDEEKIDMNKLCSDISRYKTPAYMIEDIQTLAVEAVKAARPGDVILAMSGRDFRGIFDILMMVFKNKV